MNPEAGRAQCISTQRGQKASVLGTSSKEELMEGVEGSKDKLTGASEPRKEQSSC